MTRVGVWLATAGGAGYAPIAPGTAGSAVGLLIFLLTRHWAPSWQIVLVAAVSVVGVWASTVAARHFLRDDPGQVVIDEVAGQLVTLVLTGVGAPGALLGFIVFRLLDIIKPWPAGRFEALPGGVGIMADDLMAGLYANVILQIAVRVFPGVL